MTLNKISKSFFINLDRRTDRLDHIYKHVPFYTERFAAVDANTLELNDEIKKLFPKTYHLLSKAEIACALSHYKLWKQLASDKDAKSYLILEDDVVFKEGFVEQWNNQFSKVFPHDFMLVYVGGCQPWNKSHYNEVLDPFNQHFNNIKKNDFFTKGDHYWHMNASSYIVSRRAASLLCQYVDQVSFNAAWDVFIINFFNNNKIFTCPHLVYHLNPLMARQIHEGNENIEADKNSDIRFNKDRFIKKDKTINIKYWHGKVQNFGDMLNQPLADYLFGSTHNIEYNNLHKKGIHLIGSNLGSKTHVLDGDTICGLGLHHYTQKNDSFDINVHCVRGPLSLKWLKSQGIKIAEPFLGDPGLLVSLFYKPQKNQLLQYKIGVIPHISNIDYFKKECASNEKFHIIRPDQPWQQVMDEIISCQYIISSSLHGLICADSYNVPNVWISIPDKPIPPCNVSQDNGRYKYWDYLLSQGRPINYITNINENAQNKIYKNGNKINLNELKNAILLNGHESIPKVLHVSWKNKDILSSNNPLILNGLKNFEKINPDWKIEISNDQEVDEYIQKHVSPKHYNLIKDKKMTQKTDLWRLLKVFHEGGLYIDIDRYVNIPMSKIIKKDTNCVLPICGRADFSQDFICGVPNFYIHKNAVQEYLSALEANRSLFDCAVISYMHSVSTSLCGYKAQRRPGAKFWNEAVYKINHSPEIESFIEGGPFNKILFKHDPDTFIYLNGKTEDLDAEFKNQKAEFYNSQSVVHWNADDRKYNENYKQKSKKMSLQDLLVPLKTNLTKKRYGGNGDGGYILLKEVFDESTVVYSYGIDDSDNSDSFDADCANRNKDVFMFDGSVEKHYATNTRMHFKKENVTADNFAKHLSINNNINKTNMVLKMDIEGHEYPVIEKNIKLISQCFSMLCVEFHGLNNPTFYNYENKNYVLNLLREHYDIFHMHANNWVERKFTVPNVMEISLVRKGYCLNELDNAYPIDGLDFANCKQRRDYVLDWWLPKKKESKKIKVIWQVNPNNNKETYESDWLRELLSDIDHEEVVDCNYSLLQDDSIIIYTDIWHHTKNDTRQEILYNYLDKASKYKNVSIIHLGDEYTQARTDHYKNFKLAIRTTYNHSVRDVKNLIQIPLGYKQGFHD